MYIGAQKEQGDARKKAKDAKDVCADESKRWETGLASFRELMFLVVFHSRPDKKIRSPELHFSDE